MSVTRMMIRHGFRLEVMPPIIADVPSFQDTLLRNLSWECPGPSRAFHPVCIVEKILYRNPSDFAWHHIGLLLAVSIVPLLLVICFAFELKIVDFGLFGEPYNQAKTADVAVPRDIAHKPSEREIADTDSEHSDEEPLGWSPSSPLAIANESVVCWTPRTAEEESFVLTPQVAEEEILAIEDGEHQDEEGVVEDQDTSATKEGSEELVANDEVSNEDTEARVLFSDEDEYVEPKSLVQDVAVETMWIKRNQAAQGCFADWTGSAVALSTDGDVAAMAIPGVGQCSVVRVVQYDAEGGHWNSYGQEIKVLVGHSEKSIALSGDGKILAVASSSTPATDGSALVKVFQYNEVSAAWEIVVVIPGFSKDTLGGRIALSKDGSMLAATSLAPPNEPSFLSKTKTYRILPQKECFIQMGQDIYGSYGIGDDLALSDNGTTLVLGASKHNSWRGQVAVWSYDNSENYWRQLGQTHELDGENPGDRAGFVSIAGDGSKIAIGSPANDENGLLTGKVRVLQYSSTECCWKPMGQIWGDKEGEELGSAVSLSNDGLSLAVSSNEVQSDEHTSGVARMYQYDLPTSSWKQVGKDISGVMGQETGSRIGKSLYGSVISLAANSKALAVCPRLNTTEDPLGHVQIFHLLESET
jgi:hypothetical protein